MRIHSDILTGADLHHALHVADLPDVWVEHCTRHGSHSRDHAFEVRLAAEPGRDRNGKGRRAINLGTHGAGYLKAATYDEWGYWIAVLFAIDPDAIIGYYKSAAHFHAQTNDHYPAPSEPGAPGNAEPAERHDYEA